MSEHLLSVEHVGKTFGATRALQDVSFNIAKGSIHSLLGRNGAGKSTVVNIIAGIYAQSSGNVLLEGRDITSLSVSERQRIGIKIVPQHASVVPNLTVGENVFMGVWPRSRSGFVDWTSLHREAAVELARYKLSVSTRVKVGSLNGVDQRKVNIIRAMHGGAKLIILDEPTTALSSDERQELFAFVNELKAQGTAFIFISHYLQEVVELLTARGVAVEFCKENLRFERPGATGSGHTAAYSKLLLQMLGAVGEFERALIRERQREGIAIAKSKGAYKGRKPVLDETARTALQEMVARGMKKTEIAQVLGISRATVYQYLSAIM